MKSIIIYEDKDIVVVHKPTGIATQTARLGQADIESELKNYLKKTGKNTYLGVVHRLDQPVEGLLVFAKTPAAARKLTADLQDGSLKKYYHALIPDCSEEDGGILIDYLKKDGRTNLSKVVDKEESDAKLARLRWHICGRYEYQGAYYALVEVELFTGRHHQIRVQMSHARMPLLGDNKYGTKESAVISEVLGIRSVALLASRLEFVHPVTREALHFTLPYPEEWQIADKNL